MKQIINFLFVLLVVFLFSTGCDNSSDSTSSELSKMQTRWGEWSIHIDEGDQTQDSEGNWNGIERNDYNGNFFSFWSNARNYWGSSADLNISGELSDKQKMNFSGSWNLNNGGCTVMGQGKGKGSMWTIMDYDCDVSNAGSNFYVSLYGWMDCSDPGHSLVEYYVVENYNGNFDQFIQTIADTTPTRIRRMWANGSYYSIYKTERVNKPWIYEGLGTFWQYWSIRETKRTGGTITFESHVFNWYYAGLTIGSFDHYQIMAIEGNNSNGSIDMEINYWY